MLDTDAILAATEDVLRRYGPQKATVVDVARVLGVSHGSVCRHFRSKAALREAVRRWLRSSDVELDAIAASRSIPERLTRWMAAPCRSKWQRPQDDPELPATYRVLATDHRRCRPSTRPGSWRTSRV